MKKKLVGLMIGVLVGTTAMTVFAQETAGEAETAVFEESDTIVIDDVQAPGAIGGVGGSAAAGQAGDETSSTAPGAATASKALTYDYDHLVVGTTTPFDGAFSTAMWGSNSSDLDVRSLLHGYNLVQWRSEESRFAIDPSVVSGIVVTDNAEGDRTYTLNIYDNLYYSDGSGITARDYAFSLLLSIAPQIEQIGGSLKNAEYLLGYGAYASGQASYLAGVRLLGDYMFSITIDHNYLPFFYELALLDCNPYPITEIAPGCVVRDDGQGVYIANEDENVTEPVFTADLLRSTMLDEQNGYLTHPQVVSGPYTLTSFDGETAEFERNTYYKGNFDGNLPMIEKLTFKTVRNDTMMEELADGSVGLLTKCVSAPALQTGMRLVADNPMLTMSNYARSGLSYISFCCEKPTVQSVAVRRAIALCLDKDQLVADYVSNFGLRTDGYYGIGQWMYQLLSGTMPFPVTTPENADDTAAEEAYEQEMQAWEALNLDGLTLYDLDVDAAIALLESDGWTLNSDGQPFDPANDAIRCKDVDGTLVALDLTMLVPEGNAIADSMSTALVDHLKEAGIALTVTQLPLAELLEEYYGQMERSCDMIYLASNFDVIFDPSETFRPAENTEGAAMMQNVRNTTRINDQELYDLAVAMRRTEPGDTLSYCQKWVAFEERFTQVLPCIPIYSNVYFDFYPRVLHDYNISGSISWGQEIVNAYLGDAEDVQEESETESELGEGEIIIE